MPRHGMVDMHKPSLILLTLPRQPEWLAVCATSHGEEKEEEDEEEEEWCWAGLGSAELSRAKLD